MGNFVNRVERTCKQIQLMSGANGETVILKQQSQFLRRFYFRFGILFLQCPMKRFSRFLREIRFKRNLFFEDVNPIKGCRFSWCSLKVSMSFPEKGSSLRL
jgi:hypothetical protein